jgi:organic radical activating enzyme
MGGDCSVQKTPDATAYIPVENPITVSDTLAFIDSLNPSRHHSVSMTGGEPLVQGHYLAELGAQLKRRDVPIYLETNGTQLEALEECLSCIDIIGMDWKLRSSAGGRDTTQDHIHFLKVGLSKKIFVKCVVTNTTQLDEFEQVCCHISEIGSKIPFVVQPVTAVRGVESPSPEILLHLSSVAQRYVKDVRVIPQIHKLLKLR